VGRSFDQKIISSPSRANIKWLNVVLDLNGILYDYQEETLMSRGLNMWMAQSPTWKISCTLLAERQFMFDHLVEGSLENLIM
jgi:hypothetical protein